MTGIFMIVGAGRFSFALDSGFVVKSYPQRMGSTELLSDWQDFKKEQGDTSGRIKLFSLVEMFLGKERGLDGPRSLLVVSEGDVLMGLSVSSLQKPQDASPDGLQPLPPAFPEKCRRLFPQTVVCGETALPVLTPVTVLTLASRLGG